MMTPNSEGQSRWQPLSVPIGGGVMGILTQPVAGVHLKRALSRLWASMLRNCGIPSLAL